MVKEEVFITIRGNSGVSLASGYNYYLENYLHLSMSFTGSHFLEPWLKMLELRCFLLFQDWEWV